MRTPGKVWIVKFEDVLCIDTADQGIARIDPSMNPNAEADARFIVTTWNCHDDLVAALEAILKASKSLEILFREDADCHFAISEAVMQQATKALALAKQEAAE